MDNVFFSVIIATYNAEKTLEYTIKSLINQTYKHFEIIIVDGKSNDATVSIINRYQEFIKVVISEPDKGIYDAWNKGVRNSKNEWILFIGSGDALLPNALENYAGFLEKRAFQHFDYISSKVNLVNKKGEVFRVIGKEWQWRMFRTYMCVAHVGSLHNRELFKKFGYFDINYKITGDYELLLRAKDKLRAGFVDLLTANMQSGGISASKSSLFETYLAKTLTGKVPKTKAKLDYYIALLKFWIRKLLNEPE